MLLEFEYPASSFALRDASLEFHPWTLDLRGSNSTMRLPAREARVASLDFPVSDF
jgi:hypothetical protein